MWARISSTLQSSLPLAGHRHAVLSVSAMHCCSLGRSWFHRAAGAPLIPFLLYHCAEAPRLHSSSERGQWRFLPWHRGPALPRINLLHNGVPRGQIAGVAGAGLDHLRRQAGRQAGSRPCCALLTRIRLAKIPHLDVEKGGADRWPAQPRLLSSCALGSFRKSAGSACWHSATYKTPLWISVLIWTSKSFWRWGCLVFHLKYIVWVCRTLPTGIWMLNPLRSSES